ncbi:MAG: MaoC family dehydratase [Pseudomonadales bacterium]
MNTPPFFEDFYHGQDLSHVPAVTITEGMTAAYQAMFGDRSRVFLDQRLSHLYSGRREMMVHPLLVGHVAIGQSTIPSQRVLGNLFYEGLVLKRPVHVGDTLITSTRVVGLKQNKPKEGRAATGMVVLAISVANQDGATVLDFWRCPMIPCSDPEAVTGHDDDLAASVNEVSIDEIRSIATYWDQPHFANLARYDAVHIGTDQALVIEPKDTVTSAPELVRLTLNMAMTHTDASRSIYGKRLVYGGHTISIAGSQLARGVPNLVTILSWVKCDHVGPVFEEDLLSSQVRCLETQPLVHGSLVKLHLETFAERGPEAPTSANDGKVLDWIFWAYLASAPIPNREPEVNDA